MENFITSYFDHNYDPINASKERESYPYFLDEDGEEHLLFI
ncbi:hypothetical protein [Ochrovirga pacifica]|nr:hypothetical protein [Ochrovirga pacifica]